MYAIHSVHEGIEGKEGVCHAYKTRMGLRREEDRKGKTMKTQKKDEVFRLTVLMWRTQVRRS